MHNETQRSSLTPPGETVSSVQAHVLSYHERSKHRPERYAAGPDALDWDAQPNPFREFCGAPRIRLPLIADTLTTGFDDLHAPNSIPLQPFTLDNISALLELAFGLSAWKQYGPDRWAVRCNPSSGNLHPTEAYVIAQKIDGLEDGVYHYLSRDHLLEQRGKFAASNSTQATVQIGLSSIFWREAWKYGERAFRYCQLDTGHAIGALRYAAAALGWDLHVKNCSHQELAHYLGLDRDSDFKGAEREEAELLLEITTGQIVADLSMEPEQWCGQANILDAHPMYRWPVIDEVAEASRKPSTTLASCKPAENYPALRRNAETPNRDIRAATLIRQRRSAQRFDAKFIQDLTGFYRMLDALLPRPNDHGKKATPDHETSHDRSLTLVPPLPEGEGYCSSLREFHVKTPLLTIAL